MPPDLGWDYRRVGKVVRFLLNRIGRPDVSGLHHIPSGGGIIVANHVGWLDPFWIASAVWPRPVFFMAKRELFIPVIGHILRSAGVFPIHRGAPGPSALKLPLQILAKGGLLIIFPGGTRSSELANLKRGAGTIAAMAGKPLVPTRYVGPERIHAGDFLHRPRVLVEFLDQIVPPRSGDREVREVAEELSRLIGEAINPRPG